MCNHHILRAALPNQNLYQQLHEDRIYLCGLPEDMRVPYAHYRFAIWRVSFCFPIVYCEGWLTEIFLCVVAMASARASHIRRRPALSLPLPLARAVPLPRGATRTLLLMTVHDKGLVSGLFAFLSNGPDLS